MPTSERGNLAVAGLWLVLALVNAVLLVTQQPHGISLAFRLIWTAIAMAIGGLFVRRAQTARERGARER